MSESSTSSTSSSPWKASRERGRAAQTGSERGFFKYRQQHPTQNDLVFSYYRKRSDGSYFEVWMLAEEMELRHKQRVSSNLSRARARGIPERKPAAPKQERKRKIKETQRRIQEKKRKEKQQAKKMTHEQDLKRWEILAQMLGKSVEQIMPK